MHAAEEGADEPAWDRGEDEEEEDGSGVGSGVEGGTQRHDPFEEEDREVRLGHTPIQSLGTSRCRPLLFLHTFIDMYPICPMYPAHLYICITSANAAELIYVHALSMRYVWLPYTDCIDALVTCAGYVETRSTYYKAGKLKLQCCNATSQIASSSRMAHMVNITQFLEGAKDIAKFTCYLATAASCQSRKRFKQRMMTLLNQQYLLHCSASALVSIAIKSGRWGGTGAAATGNQGSGLRSEEAPGPGNGVP